MSTFVLHLVLARSARLGCYSSLAQSIRMHSSSRFDAKRKASSPLSSLPESDIDEQKPVSRPVTKKARGSAASNSKNKASTASAAEKKDLTPSIPPPSNGLPTNKVLPPNITFPPKAPGSIRMIAWNICGLASSQKKGFKYYLEAEDPDLLVLTETKVSEHPIYFKRNALDTFYSPTAGTYQGE